MSAAAAPLIAAIMAVLRKFGRSMETDPVTLVDYRSWSCSSPMFSSVERQLATNALS